MKRKGAVFLMVLSVLWGCGGPPADQPELGEVTGMVTLDGQPLQYAQVLFQPVDGRASTGQTDQDGFYRLNFNAHTTGAKIGPHTVQITTFQEFDHPSDSNRPARPELLPAKYHQRTELTAEIQKGKNEVNFELMSK